MAKDFLSDYDANAGNNTDIGGVNLAENSMPPSAVNNALREQMSHLANFLAEYRKGADIASGAALAVDIPGIEHDVTGTTTITSLADPTNDTSHTKILQFDGALTLTHSASLVLPGAVDVSTGAGDVGVFVYDGSSVWRCVSFMDTSAGVFNGSFAGEISGLVPSNAADADHDITISTGSGWDSTGSKILTLSSAITKQIDAAWSAGDAAGGLFSGSVSADTTYHLFVIEKDSDGSIDAGFDTSLTAANIPAGYTAYRRVASFITDGSSNLIGFNAFEIMGGAVRVDYDEMIIDVSDTTPDTAGTDVAMSVPSGVNLIAHLSSYLQQGAGVNILITSDHQNNISIVNGQNTLRVLSTSEAAINDLDLVVAGTGNIQYRSTSGTVTVFTISTKGYTDPRR